MSECEYCSGRHDTRDERISELESKLHQLSEDHSHCEDLLHELGARASSAESRLDRYETLLGAAYQLAGLVDAPERFLDAFSATMGYKGDADKLLPVTLDEIGLAVHGSIRLSQESPGAAGSVSPSGQKQPCTCDRAFRLETTGHRVGCPSLLVVETGVSIEKTRPPIAPDEDGDCLRCGIRWDEEELSSAELHECPAGFRDVGE
jgi:hypothetical protein